MATLKANEIRVPSKAHSINIFFTPYEPVIAKGFLSNKGYYLACVASTGLQSAVVTILSGASGVTASDITVTFAGNNDATITVDGTISIIG